MSRFYVYSGKNKNGAHLCVCEARDGRHALQIARQMFALPRTAYTRPERIGGAK